MNKFFCDRCGKEIKKFPETKVEWPLYIIRVKHDLYSYDNVDFCYECQQKFKNWINIQ